MGRTKIAVALSGGVDSSAAAALLVDQGYDVIGVTLRMRHPDPAFSERQTCGVKADTDAIEQVVSALNIRHFYLDRYPEFEDRVLRPAWNEYAAGRTPNPCCLCNPRIKFGELIKFAVEHDAAALATGHYARLVNGRLLRGIDRGKDQSYFLYGLTPAQLGFLRFPVGEMDKSEVKKYAAALGLKLAAEKKESQDACFSADGECFAETLRRLFGVEMPEGDFRWNGRVVGRHSGVHRFTIGQRKKLNVALGVPAYVAHIDGATGRVDLVTDEALLGRDAFEVNDLNLQGELPERCMVQIRYRTPAAPGTVTRLSADRAAVRLDEPLRAVSPGQAAVFYDGDMLVGGGVIQ